MATESTAPENEMSNYKAIKTGANKKATKFALCIDKTTGAYSVWKECMNYVRGHDVITWRPQASKLTIDQATELFDRRLAGTMR